MPPLSIPRFARREFAHPGLRKARLTRARRGQQVFGADGGFLHGKSMHRQVFQQIPAHDARYATFIQRRGNDGIFLNNKNISDGSVADPSGRIEQKRFIPLLFFGMQGRHGIGEVVIAFQVRKGVHGLFGISINTRHQAIFIQFKTRCWQGPALDDAMGKMIFRIIFSSDFRMTI